MSWNSGNSNNQRKLALHSANNHKNLWYENCDRNCYIKLSMSKSIWKKQNIETNMIYFMIIIYDL